MILQEFQSYLARNRSRNQSAISAIISLPKKLYRKKLSGGDVIYGYRMYDKPIVISYSRSGMNWLRYSMEFLTNRPTPGHLRLIEEGDFLFDRAHKGYVSIHRYQKVIMLLRDYKECLLRQLPLEWEKNNSVIDFLNDKSSIQPPYWYINNLQAYHNFQGPKILVYYEDLVVNPVQEFEKIIEFLGLRKDSVDLNLFEQKLSFHRKQSVNCYEKNQKSVTSGSLNTLEYHSKKLLTSEQKIEFDSFYQNNYPDLYAKYLWKYAQSNY
ncbi:MAG: sulfotransferase domain-containing protein [Xenococcus sp. (in: cyanobacteria)]